MNGYDPDRSFEDLLESFLCQQKGRIYPFPNWALEF